MSESRGEAGKILCKIGKIAPVSTVTFAAKGPLVIPNRFGKALQLEPGDWFSFLLEGGKLDLQRGVFLAIERGLEAAHGCAVRIPGGGGIGLGDPGADHGTVWRPGQRQPPLHTVAARRLQSPGHAGALHAGGLAGGAQGGFPGASGLLHG